MLKNALNLFLCVFILFFIYSGVYSSERSDEIRGRMWEELNPTFDCVDVPDKWAEESAIIIAQLNRFEYKKVAVINELHTNKYFHNRIKLNDKNSVNKYTEISFASGSNRKLMVYTGFKIIKADGTEEIIDASEAVEMEQKVNGVRNSYKKLAIPNLEVGDILDYYICEDRVIQLASKIYYFQPIQYHLPQEYPVMKQKLEFNVQRRCFISLRSINDAPELKLEINEENDEQQYVLEDEDREAFKDIRWFYPYRELPTIKFRAAYASGKALRQNDVLLGEPGIVKNEVSKKEIADFISYLLINTYTDSGGMEKYVKKNTAKDAGNFEKAKTGYYYHRNIQLRSDEITTIRDTDQWNQSLGYVKDNRVQFLDRFSGFLANSGIPYDIVITIPRNISSLEDVLLENELRYFIRVKEGNEYLYLSPIDNFVVPGEFDADLQGADAYVVDGLAKFKEWNPKQITLPVADRSANDTQGVMDVKIDEGFKMLNISVKRSVSGNFKPYHQYNLLDYYDFEKEEHEKYEMSENFSGTMRMKKKLINLRESYLSSRDEMKNELLKSFTEGGFDFEIASVSDLKIVQTGRYDAKPQMIYGYTMETEDLLNKVGNNYLLNIGKLIEKQVNIEEDELDRQYGIYMSSPRSYTYKIIVNIPDGYKAQGLDKLSKKVETSQGGFVSTAKIDDDQLIVETQKYYKNLKAGKESWSDLVEFLNAAHQFTEEKILLRKIGGSTKSKGSKAPLAL